MLGRDAGVAEKIKPISQYTNIGGLRAEVDSGQ